jgi:hypothetical protein
MPKTRIKKKTNTTGGFQDLGYTLTDDEITKIGEIDNKINKVTSTDNAIARFDGTTGVIQNSKVTITDAGDIYSNGTKVVVESALEGLATETFVTGKIAELVDSAPEELNTLNELAEGITANKGVLETVTDAIGNKAPNNHASTATTYGVATTSKYGHVKISNGDVNTVTSSNGVAAGMDHSHSNYVQTGRAINGYTLASDVTLKLSDLDNDVGYLTSYTETDPTVPSWAKKATKPTYAYSEITGAPTKLSEFTNDAGFITNSSFSGYVPTSRTINNKTLTTNITLTASDVGAEPAFTKNTAFNKNFGTAAGTVCQGDDSRLSNARTPTAHTHVKADITDFPTIPTALSQLSADATHRTVTDTEKATWNSKSSFSGSYTDLTNKPTIPTVNNGTLTIQKNGTTVKTFTANQSSNVTANITVPTKTSELTNDSGFITSADLPTGGGVTSVVGQTGAITANQIKSGIQNANGGFAIGDGATASTGGAIGKGASSSSGFAGGQNAVATNAGVAIGNGAYATAEDNVSGFSSVAIGVNAQARLGGSIQLGYGTNTTANTLQFRNTTIVDSDGDLVFPKTIEEIGVINEASSTTFSNSSGATSITKYRFIMLVSMRSDLWRAPFVIPTAYITQDYTRIYGIECWDGGRYRIRFDNESKATITAAWYAGKVYVYGIK